MVTVPPKATGYISIRSNTTLPSISVGDYGSRVYKGCYPESLIPIVLPASGTYKVYEIADNDSALLIVNLLSNQVRLHCGLNLEL